MVLPRRRKRSVAQGDRAHKAGPMNM